MLPLSSAASMGEAGLPGGPVGFLRQPSRPRGWSGQRDSNPRHQAWEACTLPAELCPLNAQQLYLINFSKIVKAFSCLRPDLPASPAGWGPPDTRSRWKSSYGRRQAESRQTFSGLLVFQFSLVRKAARAGFPRPPLDFPKIYG